MEKLSDNSMQHTEDSREPYEKPSLEIIHLTANEVLGDSCMTILTCAADTYTIGS